MDLDASLLILGDRAFQDQLCPWVRATGNYALRTVGTANEARLAVGQQPPHVIVGQADQPTNSDFFDELKRDHQLLWVQILLVDIFPDNILQSAPMLWSSLIKGKTQALQDGADYYLSLIAATPELDRYQHDLLTAHIERSVTHAQNLQELMNANDLLSAIALVDPLTELNNRRALEWELPRQVRLSRNQGADLSLIILDIDYFKTINDTYGHLVGDQVLRLMADRFRHSMRFYDTPFRYGGEEFVLILNAASVEEAAIIGQRVRQLIADRPFTIADDIRLNVTISVGVATLHPNDDDQGHSLLKRADDCLITAKRQGRNRVILADANHNIRLDD